VNISTTSQKRKLMLSLLLGICCVQGIFATTERDQELLRALSFERETDNYWVRLLQEDSMSMPPVTPPSCPNEALNLVFIGNSYTGGRSIGRACNDDDSNRPECEFKSIPGNVRGFYQDPPEPYPSAFDQPPDSDTLSDPNMPYTPATNSHLGDVPSKMKLLAEYICSGASGDSFEYVQNTQSAFTTRSHAGESSVNPQSGTILLLNDTSRPPYEVAVIQPQSTEYLDGATSSRVSALQELTKPRNAAATNVRFILQQTWPRRESTTYNQICTTQEPEEKKGILEEIDNTMLELSENVQVGPFEVAPTGSAFVEFAKLACGPGMLPSGACAFDSNFDCPIWYGESGKISLYAEDIGEEGMHQSDEIGAWLAATVLYGVVQSDIPCYMSEIDLESVMPVTPVAELATIPMARSIHYLISEATRLALEGVFGSDTVIECGNGTGAR